MYDNILGPGTSLIPTVSKQSSPVVHVMEVECLECGVMCWAGPGPRPVQISVDAGHQTMEMAAHQAGHTGI